MTARRTNPTLTAPGMVARVHKVLAQEFKTLRQVLETYTTAPQPDSPFHKERTAWKTAVHHERAHRRRLHLGALLQARLIVVNVLDHVKGAGLLLHDEDQWFPISSHMSLSRVMCEAAGRVAYLLDPDVGYETRTVRSAVLGLFSEESNLTALRDLVCAYPDLSSALKEAERSRDKVLDCIKRAGITIHKNDKGRITKLELAGVKETAKVEAVALMAKHFAHRPAWYRLTSGITHSGAWMLDDMVASEPNDPVMIVNPDFFGIGAAGLLAVDASALVARVYALYYGYDPQPFVKANAMRSRAIDLAMNDFANGSSMTSMPVGLGSPWDVSSSPTDRSSPDARAK